MEFNMLEILTVQVYHEHLTQFGKGFSALREQIKRHVESHAPRDAGEVNILIISDLLYGAMNEGRARNGIEAEARVNPGTNLLGRLPGGLAPSVTQYLDNSSVSARWLRGFNESDRNPGNFDLHHLYSLLGELDRGPRWNIDRTVYTQARQTPVSERTAFGVQRLSYFWDSNDPLVNSFEGRYDLVLMRRGVCYCEQVFKGQRGEIDAACCGAARGDESDVAFLQKVARALKPNDRSAAYLSGWNDQYSSRQWQTATARVAGSAMVPVYREAQQLGAATSGVFLSGGRRMSANTLRI